MVFYGILKLFTQKMALMQKNGLYAKNVFWRIDYNCNLDLMVNAV